MSETKNQLFRVTWRTITQVIGAIEAVKEQRITAAYYVHEDDRFVFKRADGMQVFDVAAPLVETIEIVEDETAAA